MLAHRLQRSSGGPLNLNTKSEYQERKKKVMDYQERKVLVIIKKIAGVFYRILSAIKGCGHSQSCIIWRRRYTKIEFIEPFLTYSCCRKFYAKNCFTPAQNCMEINPREWLFWAWTRWQSCLEDSAWLRT